MSSSLCWKVMMKSSQTSMPLCFLLVLRVYVHPCPLASLSVAHNSILVGWESSVISQSFVLATAHRPYWLLVFNKPVFVIVCCPHAAHFVFRHFTVCLPLVFPGPFWPMWLKLSISIWSWSSDTAKNVVVVLWCRLGRRLQREGGSRVGEEVEVGEENLLAKVGLKFGAMFTFA